jgi:hypothetical protein
MDWLYCYTARQGLDFPPSFLVWPPVCFVSGLALFSQGHCSVDCTESWKGSTCMGATVSKRPDGTTQCDLLINNRDDQWTPKEDYDCVVRTELWRR